MAVWGGTYLSPPDPGGGAGISGNTCPSTAINTGGLYDPQLDSWTSTSTTGAPSQRVSHQLFWTGTELLVAGGCYAGGGRYAPATRAWIPTAAAGEPGPILNAHAAWTGSRLILWSGLSASNGLTPSAVVNTGTAFEPATDRWAPVSTIGAASTLQAGAASVWTGTELIVWGGQLGASGARFTP